MFDAALDAADGLAWPRVHTQPGQRWWHTQLRHLDLAQDILGLHPTQSAAVRHDIAETLAVDALTLAQIARRLDTQRGYRERGKAISAALARLTPSALLSDRLAEAGHLAGRWGSPHRWLADQKLLLRCPFRAVGTIDSRHPP